MPSLVLLDVPHLPSSLRSMVKSVSSSFAGTSSRPASRANSVCTTTTSSRRSSLVPQHPAAPEEDYAAAEQTQVIANVAAHLLLATPNDDSSSSSSSPYLGSKAPQISLADYLERLVKYANQFSRDRAGPASSGVRALLVAVELVRRSQVPVSRLTVHRLVLVCMLEAIKSHEDFPISHKFWAQVGGVPMLDLNEMELDLCVRTRFNLHVPLHRYCELQRDLGVFGEIDV